jgi:thioredoxin-like negative regulator of GroEL
MDKMDKHSFGPGTAEGDTLVVFSAPWCGPCKAMKPMLERIAGMGRIKVAEVDIDESPDLAMMYHVRSVPTLMTFRRGMPDGQLVGAVGFGEVMDLVNGV